VSRQGGMLLMTDFNKGKKNHEKQWLIGLCKRRNLSIMLSEKCNLERIIGFNEV
jgi:hypothetical protein